MMESLQEIIINLPLLARFSIVLGVIVSLMASHPLLGLPILKNFGTWCQTEKKKVGYSD